MRLIIFLCFIFFYNYSFSQPGVKQCKDTIQTDEYFDNSVDDDLIIKDSLQKKIKIIFEQDFNDKISVLTNNKIVFAKKIKTNRSLGVCLEMITIDYSKFIHLPKISIIQSNNKDCISFYPKLGKRIAYINYSKGSWSVELSNIIREYK